MLKTETRTAARTLDVFEAFSASREPLSMSELSRAISIPVSSCHALVKTLQARGYIYVTGSRRRLYPTKQILNIARAIAEHDPLLERVLPVLSRVRDDTGETVILGKQQNDAVVYLEVIEGLQTVRNTARAGEYKPLHSSAIGKALLSRLDGKTLVDILRTRKLPAITSATITDPKRLRADLRIGQKRGYFLTRGENVPDVMAIAIHVVVGEEPLGIAVAGPLQRMEANHSRYADCLTRAGRTLATNGEA
ncbi:MAG: IclR family transcriptional regulator [Acidiferrobacterales bacterium]